MWHLWPKNLKRNLKDPPEWRLKNMRQQELLHSLQEMHGLPPKDTSNPACRTQFIASQPRCILEELV